MSHENKSQSHSQEGRQAKRAQFSGSAPASSKKKLLPIIIVGAIGIGAYLLGSNLNQGPEAATVVTRSTSLPASAGAAPQAEAPAPNGDIAVPIADVSSGKAKFFNYTAAGGKTVRFFAIKSSDGVYRAALDTCDVCYAAKKGYVQDGDDMICRKCGRRFPSARINEVSGGCNPVPLTRAVEGDKLIVKAADLESGATYF